MNYNKILPIPKVPQEIIDAVNDGKLAVFIGAGVSRLLGSASWDELAYNLIKTCFEKKLINYRESDSLKQLKDPKKIITICYHLLKESNNEEIYYKTLENAIKSNTDRLNSQNIYDEIYRLRALFITTNIDSHFHKYFEPTNIVFKENEFTPSNIDRNKLYHIHGCLEKDRNSIIFTVSDYIKRYNQKKIKNFLEEIFEKYTVLFLGYGLGEFELLDFLITKSETKNKELKHFILIPFYRGEENILAFEKFYYNSIGIEVVPYEKDEKGYEQLYEVLKNWNDEINQVSGYLYDTYEYLEKLANNYKKAEEDKVFQIIKNDEPQRNYFFKCLASTPNPLPWLKPLKEKGYFNPADNPKPQEVPDKKGYFTIPYWNILGYLENVAKKNKETPSDEITNLLLEIIQEIIDYKDKNGERIENYRTDWVMVKIIFSLPIEKISNKHIEFLKSALNSKWDNSLVSSEIKETVLPKLLNEGEKAKNLILELLKVILDYKKIKKDSIFKEEDSFDYISIMDEYWLYESLKIYKPQIAKICGFEAAKIAIQKIKEIVTEDETQFNSIWIPTIEDHPQTSFPDKYQNQLVYFVRDMFDLARPEEIKEVIRNLLNEEHSIFKRIAIHIINYHYNELNQLLWHWTKDKNPLDEISVKHELFELFKNHAKDFSGEQIEKITEWIETKNYHIPKEIKTNEQKKEKYLAYQKKEWFYSLLNSGNPKIIEIYNEYNHLEPTELRHPGFNFWMETKWGYESLVDIEEFLNKSNEEIVKYLDRFKDKGNIDIERISDSFRNAVKEKPEKFNVDMKPFLKIQRIYQHSLLWGLKEAWDLRKPINWDILFDFISDLISSDDFWNEEYKTYNYRDWIISQIAELIKEGTKDDKHAFEPELLPKAEKILLILFEKTKSNLTDMVDLVTSVLNSTKGKIFSAMINYSLRYARLYKTESEERWIESIKEKFTKRLDRNIDPSIEFSVILGQYLANLYWLDKNWVINHINQIFPKENETHWQAAFTGYLFYSSRIYKDIYFLLRENNHYLKAIKTSFKDEHITERLAQHIAIGYIENCEKLDDEKSLISQLIKNGNKKQFLAIITFFWMMREGINDKIKTKIKPLWKSIFNELKDNLEVSENQEIISKFIEWLAIIDEIDDEIFEWLKPTVRYSSKYHNNIFLSEYLLKHVSKTPQKVGELFIEMLNNNIYLDYKIEDIQKTIEILYERGEKELADRICNLYGARGFDFLRDIYFEYNKKES
ncbi:SIR2 family protein [Deferribacter thermophilus]|uniref:SIR2 family protein n=1 Tax=Deferribacter thermophilus TaxID=53573 RepID=UPI003C181C11